MDALRAMRIIRKNAKYWNLNSGKIGVIGFSAGGHLASTLSTHYDKGLEKSTLSIDKFSSRPDFSALIYPVITMKNPNVNMGSRENLLGKIPDREKLDYFSNELWVNHETPPTILIHASDDKVVVPENSLSYYKALVDHGVDAELHIWQNGGHGFGISEARGSIRNWLSVIKEWMMSNEIIENDIVD
jgi:acetyl esterase/lipase